MRVLLFGTGIKYQEYKHVFQKVKVLALLDNDSRKIGSELDGHPILLPSDGAKLDFDKIFVLSVYENGIRDQLYDLGVDSDKIFGLQEVGVGLGCWKPDIAPVIYKGERGHSTAKGRVCVLTWHFNLSGGPIAMLGLADALLKLGYEVTAMTFSDGPMREQFLAIGTMVVIDMGLCCKRMDEIYGAGQYCAIWTDASLVLQMLVDSRNPDPLNMWFHAGESSYRNISPKLLARMNTMNVNFYAVGEFPRQAFLRRRPDLSVTLLPYGIKDEILPEENLRHKIVGDKIVFAIIGGIQPLKGQDVFLQAVEKLTKNELKNASFRIIGKLGTQKQYNEQLMNQIDMLRSRGAQIEYLGELGREDMKRIYGDIDVIVSASREDAMPIVCTEGAMHCCAVVCSDQVGFKAFVENGNNGHIFKSEDSVALAAVFKNYLVQTDSVVKIGRNARTIYEDIFDMSVFQRNIENVISTTAL